MSLREQVFVFVSTPPCGSCFYYWEWKVGRAPTILTRQISREDLGLDDHPLSTQGLLHMEPEDEPVEIPKPRVLSALNHCLTRVCNLDRADAGLEARIPKRGIKRHQLPIVLQQRCLPRDRAKGIRGKRFHKRRHILWTATLISTVDGSLRNEYLQPCEIGILRHGCHGVGG